MRIKVMPDGQLRYCYEVSPEVAFEFSLKSEVGEPWQADAEASLQELLELEGGPSNLGSSLTLTPGCLTSGESHDPRRSTRTCPPRWALGNITSSPRAGEPRLRRSPRDAGVSR